MNSKTKTQLNPKFRVSGLSVNSRKWKSKKVIYAHYEDENCNKQVIRTIDQYTANGGVLTPFNILCNCAGAPAIRTIVKSGDDTIVVFGDGDRVVLKRHEGDKDDPVTAVLWALGQKVFGKSLVRQIHTALKYRLVDAAKEHAKKAASNPNLAGPAV